MKPKVTPWFPAGTRPAHVGVYEVKQGCFQFWDGAAWRCRSVTPEFAYLDRGNMTLFRKPIWRGLAEKPK